MHVTHDSTPISPAHTVNEAILRHPAALEVFRRHGIDACCGGARPIGEVAVRHGLDAERLLEELNAAAG